ncbi:CHAT domain-containing protein [Zoogloea sp.]|uniref:CHAT domain-containing protein n=1 Tax=Zoogloea sp. TaxID=49181 RepID=UPI0025D4D1B7|nr:CHAT domain-containing protein [Zoogloea sp.]MCK6395901.1 CHAT domain-containing protein [Zoogloea sp.]
MSSPAPRPLFRLPLGHQAQGDTPSLPGTLSIPGSRAADGRTETLLPNVSVKRSWTLAPASRSSDAPSSEALGDDIGLLALETVDGSTVFMHADVLAAQLRRTRPELLDADGAIDFARFRDNRATTRGAADWIWRKISELEIGRDEIIDAALEQLREKLEDKAVDWASRKGAKALMEAIESRLAGPPGIYAWRGGELTPADRCTEGSPQLAAALAAGPALLFIHGTGSHTLSGFGALPASKAWREIDNAFSGRIFGFEHRTFSESPIDNALRLLRTLPDDARLHLVTHSRGGLVGDLLALDPHDPQLDELIEQYTRPPRPDEADAERQDPALKAERLKGEALEQAALRELVGLMKQKRLRIERYVRVGCPARGTALLSDNLDLFLSGLLNGVRRFGAWGVGALVGSAASPVAGETAKRITNEALRFLTRVVLEIADKRIQPGVVPGIEAMLPEAPIGTLLGRAAMAPSVRVALIAGDVEGDPNSFFHRVGVMFVDWALFDRARNDLVVDTDSMYGGLANRARGVRAIYVHGPQVNHFRYFRDDVKSRNVPLPTALHQWLVAPDPDRLEPWQPLGLPEPDAVRPRRVSRGGDERPADSMPVVVYVPGIMGSHLKADNQRVWLAPLALASGKLTRIAMDSGRGVSTDGLVDLAYGELADWLDGSHRVVRFDYDWRQPILALGQRLATTLREALVSHPNQPVRILAHSMGGLVTRAAFAADSTLWRDIVARPGGRLLMLGTPNNGSHLFVETLLGQSDTIRTLARADLQHGMQAILDIVAGFPGAVHLLPAPGFVDTAGVAEHDFYAEQTWVDLAALNNDFWFGRHLAGRPAQATLQAASDFWKAVADTRWVQEAPERIAYVFGQADNTPCGLLIQRDGDTPVGVALRGTPNGDGSVTWKSGYLAGLPEDRYWYMPADHMGLTSTEKYFGEIQSLLAQGSASRLGRLPVSRGAAEADRLTCYRGGPPPAYPTPLELTSRALGGRPRVQIRGSRRALAVSVRAMDLRFVQVPLMCGHYRGDPISGAEAVIDRWLVDGALSHRQRLGIHTGDLGNATVALAPRSREERLRGTGRGAVVVGLGEMGKLSAEGVTEAVRAGALRYLLHAADRYTEEAVAGGTTQADGEIELSLASLLIGTNSAAQLDGADALKAIVLGVLRANREFAEGAVGRDGARRAVITRLELIEVYRDAALSAAHALRQLDEVLASDLLRLEARLDIAEELQTGEGVRQRLSLTPFGDYWPRLAVSDADGDDTDRDDGAPVVRHARRLRFVYMGEKARAESIIQQRQPGLVETLVDRTLNGPGSTSYSPDTRFGNTLFQLLVPLEFKAVARKTSNLILVVDEGTANLPWEMLEADGQPLIRSTRMVRQFATTAFRREVIRTDALSACVIANPSSEGFHAQFGPPGWKATPRPDGSPGWDELPSLAEAAREGEAAVAVLEASGYDVNHIPPDATATQVFAGLFARPWRIVVICAHGIYARQARDGSWRSGVVLSDGLLLSATEIALMENVPDLVYLSCCNLGKAGINEGGGNRLAASLARELIDMGVRCVVAAGWEVRDDAARTFAEAFFGQMTIQGARFGDAIFKARNATFDTHPDCNTWGAYQAYGDPAFQLRQAPRVERDDAPMQAPDELIDWLEQRRLDCRLPGGGGDFKTLTRRITTRLNAVPAAWQARPDLQAALGRLYAEYQGAGFEAARSALLQAVAADSSLYGVPIASIELLANIEAREAARRSEAGSPPDLQRLAEASALLDTAIGRLEALLTRLGPATPNPERQFLLGSALKRKALLAVRSQRGWAEVAGLLTQARDAYATGEGDPATPGWNPYGRINRVQLDALLGQPGATDADVEVCITATRARFRRSFDFFDAVMQADAALAQWLRTDQTPAGTGSPADYLLATYRDAIQSLAPSPRAIDSVVRQLDLLCEFLAGRKQAGDTDRAAVLQAVAQGLSGRPGAGEDSTAATRKPRRRSASPRTNA